MYSQCDEDDLIDKLCLSCYLVMQYHIATAITTIEIDDKGMTLRLWPDSSSGVKDDVASLFLVFRPRPASAITAISRARIGCRTEGAHA